MQFDDFVRLQEWLIALKIINFVKSKLKICKEMIEYKKIKKNKKRWLTMVCGGLKVISRIASQNLFSAVQYKYSDKLKIL